MSVRIERFAVGDVVTELWIIQGPGYAASGIGDLILAEQELIELRDRLLERLPVEARGGARVRPEGGRAARRRRHHGVGPSRPVGR